MLFCLFSLGISKVVGIKFNCSHLGNAWACECFLHVGTAPVNLQAAKLNWNQVLACHIGEILPFFSSEKNSSAEIWNSFCFSLQLDKKTWDLPMLTARHHPDISSIITRFHLVLFSAGYPGGGGGGLIAELPGGGKKKKVSVYDCSAFLVRTRSHTSKWPPVVVKAEVNNAVRMGLCIECSPAVQEVPVSIPDCHALIASRSWPPFLSSGCSPTLYAEDIGGPGQAPTHVQFIVQ